MKRSLGTLTDFQVRCEARVTAALRDHGLQLTNRRIEGYEQPCIIAEIAPLATKIWIYGREAELSTNDKSYIFESPDYPDEQTLITKFADAVAAVSSGKNPPDPGSSRFLLFKLKKM